MEQVRQHLLQMGFGAVPDDVLAELHSELVARVSSAAPTPLSRKSAPSKGKQHVAAGAWVGAGAGYDADHTDSEFERDKENATSSTINTIETARGHAGSSTSKRNLSKPQRRPFGVQPNALHDATPRDYHPRTVPVAARSAGVSIEGHAVELDRADAVGAGGKSAQLRSSSSVFGAKSVAASSSSGLIRPSTQMYGRTPRRADPVSSFNKAREAWKLAPSVAAGGLAGRRNVGHIASLQEPGTPKVWKSVHPLQNSSYSDYKGPQNKLCDAEREQVRSSLAWNQVYNPPKIDRVQVNLEQRQYVVPVDKRRDDVRWQARVMMAS